MVFRWGRWKKVIGLGGVRTLNYCDVGGLGAVVQDVRTATKTPALGVWRLRILFSLIRWSIEKRGILPTTSGRNRRTGV